MLQRAQHQTDSSLAGRRDEQMVCCDGHEVQNNKRYPQLLSKPVKFYSSLSVALKNNKLQKNLVGCFEFR